MPKTRQEQPTHREEYPDTPEEAFLPIPRDGDTQEKLDDTEALLDEIDAVLDTEVIEHELTLSDLLRRGAKLAPQAFGALRTPCGKTCALGAIEDGARDLGLIE